MQLYKSIYKDIVRGFSVSEYEGEALYVKHFKDVDYGEIDHLRYSFIDAAEKRGLASEKKKLEACIASKDWSTEKENKIIFLKSEIEGLVNTKKKLFIRSQLHSINNDIKKREAELSALAKEREGVIGYTSERYADSRINSEYIYRSLFKDSSLTESFFSREEFDYLSQADLFLLTIQYNSVINLFSEKNIRSLAFQSFLLNNFYLCEDDPMVFFGKPIVDLTVYQLALFSQAKHHKFIISRDGMPPQNILDNDAQLSDWFDSSDGKNNLKKGDKDASTIVGATKEELKKISDPGNSLNLSEEAAKMMKEKGQNSLSLQDLIKLHGH